MSVVPEIPDSPTPPAGNHRWLRSFFAVVTVCLGVSVPVGLLVDWSTAVQVFVATATVATAIVTVGQR